MQKKRFQKCEWLKIEQYIFAIKNYTLEENQLDPTGVLSHLPSGIKTFDLKKGDYYFEFEWKIFARTWQCHWTHAEHCKNSLKSKNLNLEKYADYYTEIWTKFRNFQTSSRILFQLKTGRHKTLNRCTFIFQKLKVCKVTGKLKNLFDFNTKKSACYLWRFWLKIHKKASFSSSSSSSSSF